MAQWAHGQEDAQRTLECGCDCVFVAIEHFLPDSVSYEVLRKSMGEIGEKGYTLRQMHDAVLANGLQGSMVETTLDGLNRVSGDFVAILHLKKGHFVVATDCTSKSISVFDPATESLVSLQPDEWSGYALLVSMEPIALGGSDSNMLLLVLVGLVCVVAGLLGNRYVQAVRNRN
jgi:ABC-type bacteriocin/lantibiotic exporter with double-glycine peptidase domain